MTACAGRLNPFVNQVDSNAVGYQFVLVLDGVIVLIPL